MLRVTKLRYGFPIGLLLFFYLDGILGAAFPKQLFNYPYTMSSYLVVLWLVYSIYFEDQITIPLGIWAAVAGGLFDLYYTGIFGIFVFVFPIVVALTRACYKAFQSIFFEWLISVFYRHYGRVCTELFWQPGGSLDECVVCRHACLFIGANTRL